MNFIVKIFSVFTLIFLVLSCDKPSPTELIDDSNQSENFQVEVISKDTEDEFYSNGFDTSGVVQTEISSIISITGGKFSFQGQTEKFSLAQTIIFDKNNPVYNSSGKLIAYKTITPGSIKFNNLMCRLVDFRIRYRDAGQIVDTLLGKKYTLYKGRGYFQDNFDFPYNSFVSFTFNPLVGPTINFNIPTPSEVNGSVRFEGNRNEKNLRAVLQWNASYNSYFSIVIGAAKRNSQDVFPLYRIKTQDDGSLIIPPKLLLNISRDRFDKFVFTFIRSYDNRSNIDNQNVFISSQSIHTIYVALP
ncbi:MULTISPECIES: hypothetical protein [Ignavibacterium]|jgi:hypothetical protein|uniref:hypothetical protein n=1 Tax=Ignavibacterium TaxID=795750 RepID=UPI0025C652AC|nr:MULTISPECIES: hypothetical protein [Ignavibacterium]MBI5662423.1 hypothetical protein [Ignavibacterium album]